MKIKSWKTIVTMLTTMSMGGLPGAGLFFLFNYLKPALPNNQLFAFLCFNYAVLMIGLLLGAIFGVGSLILQTLNKKLYP